MRHDPIKLWEGIFIYSVIIQVSVLIKYDCPSRQIPKLDVRFEDLLLMSKQRRIGRSNPGIVMHLDHILEKKMAGAAVKYLKTWVETCLFYSLLCSSSSGLSSHLRIWKNRLRSFTNLRATFSQNKKRSTILISFCVHHSQLSSGFGGCYYVGRNVDKIYMLPLNNKALSCCVEVPKLRGRQINYLFSFFESGSSLES